MPLVEAVRHMLGSVQMRGAGAVIEDEDGRQQAVARDVRHQQHFARARYGFALVYQKPTRLKEQRPISSQQR